MTDRERQARRTAFILLLAIAILSLAALGKKAIAYQAASSDYQEAQALAGSVPILLPDTVTALERVEEGDAPDHPSAASGAGDEAVYANALAVMDLASLREINPGVLGWISIPGTSLSYPLLQGVDNQYYLTHTWTGRKNPAGAIFLECRNSAALDDFNTIVYGHRTWGGAMFSVLGQYGSQAFWSAHPMIYITTDAGAIGYEIYAAYEAGVMDAAYQLGLPLNESKQAFIDSGLARSVIQTGVRPQPSDQILTLSTCTAFNSPDSRWVVQAVRRN